MLCMANAGCSKRDHPAPAEEKPITVTLAAGDTLGKSLQDVDLSPASRNEIIRHLSGTFNLRRCKAGDEYVVRLSTGGCWREFVYYPSGMEYYLLRNSSAGIAIEKKTRVTIKSTASARGTLKTSLWESMTAQHLPPEIIMRFADIFAWQIDFLTECKTGDTFRVIYEQYTADNGLVTNTQILAAQYGSGEQHYTAFLFTHPDGKRDFYTPDGKSLRSAFLRAPLQFSRISSHFTKRRYHPVLKYFRPHLGIDYAAPRGTPVSAIGEGTVTYAGWKGGFGNYVGIRHPNGYASYYGHLSRFAKGVRTGTHVRQGQVIAYVGSTGISTGPHLDFRVTKNGSFINFLRLRFPAAATLAGAEKTLFAEQKKQLLTQLAAIPSTR
jgi:murein DD-endopeptidase MepM/ murein hydrolase activator NlpD